MTTEFEQALELLNERCLMHTQHLDSLAADLKKAVFGNGTEGLGSRMTKMEMSVASVQKELGSIEEDRAKVRWTFYGILASLVLMIIGAMATQYIAYEKAYAVQQQSQNEVMETQALLKEINAKLSQGDK